MERIDGGVAPADRRPGRLTPVNAVIVIAALLALGLRLYSLTRPGRLLGVTEYDDGPYFGSAVRLVYGELPYKDFVFVQPPGITLLMSPVGLLSKVIGTRSGLVVGRLLTILASTAGVVLAGLLVRHRGLLAVTVTCGLLAIYHDSVAAAHTVLVEPWLALFCLAGLVTVFDGDRLAGTRRLAWGGVAFGFGGVVEPWAIVPVIVVFVLCLPNVRRAAVFTAGVAAGFLVPVAPFAALAPQQFYRSLIVAQIGYRAHATRVGVWLRLQNMIGVPRLLSGGHRSVLLVSLVIVVFVAGAMFVSSLITRRLPPPLDWFAVLTAALVVAMFLWPPQFHYHFAAFLAPFLALAIALSASRLVEAAQSAAGVVPEGNWLGWSALALAGVGIAVLAVVQIRSESLSHRIIGPRPAAAAQVIPAGACVLSDQVTYLLLANRFVSHVPGCPLMVDGLGTDLALSNGLSPTTGAGRVPAVAAVWHEAFHRAQYILLSSRNHRRIAWTPELTSYFRSNFTQVLAGRGYTVYARRALPSR